MNPGTDIYTLLIQRRDEILTLAHRRGAKNVRVFGSVARKEAREDSDLDILIDLDPTGVFSMWGVLRWTFPSCSTVRSTL